MVKVGRLARNIFLPHLSHFLDRSLVNCNCVNCNLAVEMSTLSVPASVQKLFSIFPLHIVPEQRASTTPSSPTLWIRPPVSTLSSQSQDVVCLKWQAYLVLRGIRGVRLRWDIGHDGAVHGRLPNLHLPDGELLEARKIPAWADRVHGSNIDVLEGFRTIELKDESRAWTSLLESSLQAALVRIVVIKLSVTETKAKLS